jgi:hypothetical protein
MPDKNKYLLVEYVISEESCGPQVFAYQVDDEGLGVAIGEIILNNKNIKIVKGEDLDNQCGLGSYCEGDEYPMGCLVVVKIN